MGFPRPSNWLHQTGPFAAANCSPTCQLSVRSRGRSQFHHGCGNGGWPRVRTEFSPVKSRDFTVKVCNPNSNERCGSRKFHSDDLLGRQPCSCSTSPPQRRVTSALRQTDCHHWMCLWFWTQPVVGLTGGGVACDESPRQQPKLACLPADQRGEPNSSDENPGTGRTPVANHRRGHFQDRARQLTSSASGRAIL